MMIMEELWRSCRRRCTAWCNILADLCAVHKARAGGHQERRLGQRCLQREAIQRGGDGRHAGRRSEEGLGQRHHPHHHGRHPPKAVSCGVRAARPDRFHTHCSHCRGFTLTRCSSVPQVPQNRGELLCPQQEWLLQRTLVSPGHQGARSFFMKSVRGHFCGGHVLESCSDSPEHSTVMCV